jgi:hypothetical protein
LLRERFLASRKAAHADEAPEVDRYLSIATFFTELVRRPALRARIWPEAGDAGPLPLRERFLRGQLLSAAARLGHAFIDLYLVILQRIGSLDPGAQEAVEGGPDTNSGLETIHAFLDRLEAQRDAGSPPWSAFHELELIATHYRLIVDVNLPEFGAAAETEISLAEARRLAAILLGRQQPVGGMSGAVNRTQVKQFRMPGYPFVLVSTDLLQEGEDLHTFCSEVVHYGISWTPSSIEQRIGRVDRVGSEVERRLRSLDRPPTGAEQLQVYYPYLGDTVEVLQVRRVLGRVNEFLRLMHEGLSMSTRGDSRIHIGRELLSGDPIPPAINDRLTTSFAIDPRDLQGEVRTLAVGPGIAEDAVRRFLSATSAPWPGLAVEWTERERDHVRMGTLRLPERIQPFTLRLRSLADRLLVRCVSPVGIVHHAESDRRFRDEVRRLPGRIMAIELVEDGRYDLAIVEDTLLATSPESDAARIAAIVTRACEAADRIEQILLPDRDRALAEFRDQLERQETRDE